MSPRFRTIPLLALATMLAAVAIADHDATKTVEGTPPAAAAKPATPTVTALAIGASAPMRNVRMKNVNGKLVSIADAAGEKGTLVIFTCNQCPWAKKWQGRIAKTGNAAIAKGVGVIAVNSNDPAAVPGDDYQPMKQRAKELGLKFPYVVDATSEVARAFGASRTPEIFLFDAEGKLVYHGAVDDNANDEKAVENPWLDQAVDAVVTGRPVSTTETKAFGCTIKYRKGAASTTS